MKVLMGLDGSDGSLKAAHCGGQLLSVGRDQVCFYYSPPGLSLRSTVRVEPSIIERTRNALAESVFEAGAAQLPPPLRASVGKVIGAQPPHQGLAAAAQQEHADMIVVGASGAGFTRRMGVGSVGRAVVHRTHLPVLLIRDRGGSSVETFHRILFACDDSPASRKAAEFLGMLRWPDDAQGYVISVVESVLEGAIPEWLAAEAKKKDADAYAQAWSVHHDQQIRERQTQLAELCAKGLPAPFRKQTPRVVEGHPGRQILAAIDELKIDLVVVGARGLHFWDRLLLGSTSENLIAHAPCSLLIVGVEHPG